MFEIFIKHVRTYMTSDGSQIITIVKDPENHDKSVHMTYPLTLMISNKAHLGFKSYLEFSSQRAVEIDRKHIQSESALNFEGITNYLNAITKIYPEILFELEMELDYLEDTPNIKRRLGIIGETKEIKNNLNRLLDK